MVGQFSVQRWKTAGYFLSLRRKTGQVSRGVKAQPNVRDFGLFSMESWETPLKTLNVIIEPRVEDLIRINVIIRPDISYASNVRVRFSQRRIIKDHILYNFEKTSVGQICN